MNRPQETWSPARRRGGARRRRAGFTLVEALVTAVLVAVAVTGSLTAIAAIERTDSHAQTVDLLQRLASEKLSDLSTLTDPTQEGSSGDFTDRGYPDITWNLDIEQVAQQTSGQTTSTESSSDNLDQVIVTVTEGKDSQSLTTFVYILPTSTTSTGAAAGGAAGGAP